MIFQNSPFELLDKAFKTLYPNKRYMAYIDVDMQDENGEKVCGCTQFNDDNTPIIFIDASLSIKNAVEIFAHELAHVAAGEQEGHGELWEKAFDEIQNEYNRIGTELYGTANKELSEKEEQTWDI